MLNLDGDLKLLSVSQPNPFGYGRLIRDDHNYPAAIIEEVDASSAQKEIKEVFTGILSGSVEQVKSWINTLDNNNKQQKYLLTDIVAKAHGDQVSISAHCAKIILLLAVSMLWMNLSRCKEFIMKNVHMNF